MWRVVSFLLRIENYTRAAEGKLINELPECDLFTFMLKVAIFCSCCY